MRTASRLLLTSIASLSFAGTALAQDSTEPAAGDAAPAGDATAPAATDPAATPAPDMGGDAAAMGAWPRSINDRPLTLTKGLLSLQGDIATFTSNFFDPALIRLGVGYGITDDFELNFAAYSFSTDDAGKGSIDAGLGYKLVRGGAGGKLEIIARATVGYHLYADGDLNPIGLGLDLRYRVTPKISILTGSAQTGTSPHLSIGVVDPKIIDFSLPIGVGFQASPELYIQADTSIGTITISHPDGVDPGNRFIFDKETPLSLTAFYNAMPALDVYANLTFGNLTPPDGVDLGDTVSVGVGARYFIGDAVKPGAAPAAM